MERTFHDAGITITGKPYKPCALQICDTSGDPVVTIHCNGRVEISPHLSMDEAAQAFWDAVRQMNPRWKQ